MNIESFVARTLIVIAFCLEAGVSLATPIDDRLLTAPTGWLMWNNVNAQTIINSTNQNYRATDLEVTNGPSGPTFSATMVDNSGLYATDSWWYYGTTANQLSAFAQSNQARLTALRPYLQPDGSTLFGAVMMSNIGQNQENWWFYVGLAQSDIATYIGTNNARLIDLQSYTENAQTKYSVILVDNSGQNAKNWWWYSNVTTADINTYLTQNNARVYSLSRSALDPNRFDVILTPDDGTPWYWFTNATNTFILDFATTNGLRPIDIEQVPQGNGFLYDGVLLGESTQPRKSVV